jgi:hypothetical protein
LITIPFQSLRFNTLSIALSYKDPFYCKWFIYYWYILAFKRPQHNELLNYVWEHVDWEVFYVCICWRKFVKRAWDEVICIWDSMDTIFIWHESTSMYMESNDEMKDHWAVSPLAPRWREQVCVRPPGRKPWGIAKSMC